MTRKALTTLAFCAALLAAAAAAGAQPPPPPPPPPPSQNTTVARLIEAVRERARHQQGSAGQRLAYSAFLAAHGLAPEHVPAADFAVVRLLFEATRDAGLWNLRWTITDLPPESDRIWQQWATVRRPSVAAPTAAAECDELSALFAFLARRAGVRGIGLLWPTSNHTVAAWELKRPKPPAVRVVVPTTQIFLTESDRFGTLAFDPWRQRTIYEYTRRDVPDSFALPAPLFELFLRQLDKYGGASDATLQRLRYLREGLLQGRTNREQAAAAALAQLTVRGAGAEDAAALRAFAQDLRAAR